MGPASDPSPLHGPARNPVGAHTRVAIPGGLALRIALASDHAGFALRAEVRKLLVALGHQALDLGCPTTEACDYPDYAFRVADAVLAREAERGILICGTGIGMAMCANRVPGIRAALASDAYSARVSRAHNDANVLCLGGRTMGPEVALDIVRVWVETPFSNDERHMRRLALMREREEQERPCGQTLSE